MSSNDPTDAGDSEIYGDYSVDDETQLNTEDTLGDQDVDDELDRGYSPPERYSAAQGYGNTEWEQAHDQPLEDRLKQEEPEPDPYAEAEQDEAEQLSDHEVGGTRAGRLVDPDEGAGEDVDKDLIGRDVGIDGAAASAEEAAMHVIDGQEEDAG